MTIQEKKQSVRQAIIRAVPSVMDLVFGCEIKTRFDGNVVIVHRYITNSSIKGWAVTNGRDGTLVSDENIIEIIGRPITLQDIIYTIHAKNGGVEKWVPLEPDISIAIDDLVNIHYDMLQDFDHQSEQTIGFLWSLLCE